MSEVEMQWINKISRGAMHDSEDIMKKIFYYRQSYNHQYVIDFHQKVTDQRLKN